MALRIFGDLHALPPEHAALGRAWPQSPAHGFYTATISLTLFRAGAVIFAAILLWRRHWAGLAIAGIVFCTELYSEGMRDWTGGSLSSIFGQPATDTDALARALGRYSMLVMPLALIAWASLHSKARSYFRHAI